MNEIKIFVKNLIVSDPLEAIDKLEALIIIQHNKRKDDYYRNNLDTLILNKARYLTTMEGYNQGVIEIDKKNLTFQQVLKALLDCLNTLPEDIFTLSESEKSEIFYTELMKNESLNTVNLDENRSIEFVREDILLEIYKLLNGGESLKLKSLWCGRGPRRPP